VGRIVLVHAPKVRIYARRLQAVVVLLDAHGRVVDRQGSDALDGGVGVNRLSIKVDVQIPQIRRDWRSGRRHDRSQRERLFFCSSTPVTSMTVIVYGPNLRWQQGWR
jgi:hypothetical protein